MSSIWDGITKAESLSDWALEARNGLADAAHYADWAEVLAILSKHSEFVNSARPGGESWYAPLHQAAHHGVSLETVRALLDAGAWRTLRNASCERPLDVAATAGHVHLLGILEPSFLRDVSRDALLELQHHLHAVIRGRAGDLVWEHDLRLPELEPLLELEEPEMWFPVPGMYGGFLFTLEGSGNDVSLISESWCRVAEESGQRHVITPDGCEIVAKGFV